MTEIQDLLGLYGAIDRAIVADPSLAEVAAPFLGPYRGGAAAGWFDEFTRWTSRRTGVEPEEQYPDLDRALTGLAGAEPTPRMAARRLLAVAVAGRVIDRVGHGGGDAVGSISALTAPGLAADEDTAAQLFELMLSDQPGAAADDATTGPESLAHWWSSLLHEAKARGLIADSLARQSTVPPCSGRLVQVGAGGLAAALSTRFCTDQLTLAEAKGFLDPASWPGCHPFWCEMTQTGVSSAGNPIYREVVSVDCDNRAQVWTAEVCLEFQFLDLPGGGALVTYRLCEGFPQPDDLVVVDSGTLAVWEQDGNVCVHTTKRIRFDHPFDGPSLAMLMCALGYGSVAEDLVFSCAVGSGEGSAGAATFSGRDPADVVRDRWGGAAFDDTVQAAVTATTRCIEDCADAYRAAYGKAEDGTYTADDLVQDGVAMSLRLLRDVGLVADLGVRAARSVARTDTPPARSS
jgi:hypothetical protein